ncbi:MAG TPA: type II toxin-antitoxin system VapC family toxin [Spirochaetia bacterium]|nr:type II toxin-antitoxin system VapC family toxin [Spirochaetia bacterium]
MYIDSSVVLGHILAGDPALSSIRAEMAGSSELLLMECHRVLHRERMSGNLDDTQYAQAVELLETVADRLAIIELGPAVKRRAAGSFPTVIGTLDAIHLATAVLWQESEPASPVRIVTKDRQLALCAKTMGLT